MIFVGLLALFGSLVVRRRKDWLFAAPPRADGVALGIVLYCVFVGITGILLVLGPLQPPQHSAQRTRHLRIALENGIDATNLAKANILYRLPVADADGFRIQMPKRDYRGATLTYRGATLLCTLAFAHILHTIIPSACRNRCLRGAEPYARVEAAHQLAPGRAYFMTTDSHDTHADALAHRLESVTARITTLAQQPHHAERLRNCPGPDEWSVLQTIGHLTEMIPHWLRQCRAMIDASGAELPRIGRSFGDSERLAGPARGAVANPVELVAHLQSETQSAGAAIRALTAAQRAKQGIDGQGNAVSVDDVVGNFIVAHAEGHLSQIEQTLGAAA